MRKGRPTENDKAILLARENTEAMIDRLIEIASSEPSSHVSVKAAEVVVRIGREQTSIEKDPYGVLDFPVEFDED